MPESTIRYYKTHGLLPLLERDEAERRLFSEKQMAPFRTIICLKNTHISITRIKQYINWIIEGNSTIQLRLAMMENHKQDVIAEISLMKEVPKRK
ncbi:MerR family transcriptional regulator [Niallia circulans]|uniref:MerR family transcriptional regulator n=1 Tax=Niallia circulans TaxID=1397 RepID=UPI00352C1880